MNESRVKRMGNVVHDDVSGLAEIRDDDRKIEFENYLDFISKKRIPVTAFASAIFAAQKDDLLGVVQGPKPGPGHLADLGRTQNSQAGRFRKAGEYRQSGSSQQRYPREARAHAENQKNAERTIGG